MAGKCGCAGTTCSCKITGSGGISVTGAGTASNPYVVSGGGFMEALDTATVDLTLLGSGSATDPFTLSANVSMGLGDLTDVDDTTTTAGYVLARHSSGGFYFAPPATAAPGAIATGNSLEGDGSGGDPLEVRLASQSGLQIVAGGLQVLPRTVTTEADLDSLYGSAPVGALVSDTDGSGAWIKTASGWQPLFEDTGTITTIGSNINDASGWDIDSFSIRRRNGIVQMFLLATTTVSRSTGIDTGNLGNIDVATLNMSQMKPVFYAGLGAASVWGPIVGAGIGPTGNVVLGAIIPGAVIDAGTQISFIGTWIGA